MKHGILVFLGAFLLSAAGASTPAYRSWKARQPEEVVARVTGKQWWRHVHVEELRNVTADSTVLPEGALVLGVAPAAPDSARVLDHVTIRGDSVFRKEPVYVPRYRFQARTWVDTLLTRQGTGDEAPEWPEVTLRPGQREEERTGEYRMFFTTDDGEHFDAMVEWRNFERWRVGQAVRLSVNRHWAEVRLLGGVESEVPWEES